jgi:hypothetical protein
MNTEKNEGKKGKVKRADTWPRGVNDRTRGEGKGVLEEWSDEGRGERKKDERGAGKYEGKLGPRAQLT